MTPTTTSAASTNSERKAAAAFLSLFVLAALVLVGVAIGVAIVYYWNDILDLLGR